MIDFFIVGSFLWGGNGLHGIINIDIIVVRNNIDINVVRLSIASDLIQLFLYMLTNWLRWIRLFRDWGNIVGGFVACVDFGSTLVKTALVPLLTATRLPLGATDVAELKSASTSVRNS